MFRISKFVLIGIAVLVLFAGCDNIPFFKAPGKREASGRKPPIGAIVVARVGNFYVTQDDLNKEIANYNDLLAAQGMEQNKIDTREEKIAYLRDEVVRKYILYQEALDRGLDERQDIAQTLENAKISLLVSELLREEIGKVNVTSKEIEDFYNQNKDLLKEPEQRKILEIVTPTEAEAKQVYVELLKDGDFATLARQHSKGKTASKGGDLGYISVEPDPAKRIRFDKFYEVAFSPTLDTGGISSIFKGTDGNYYIIKVESIKKAEAKSLNELWDNIKSYLLFEKQQKVIADLGTRLSGETKIEIYEGKVE